MCEWWNREANIQTLKRCKCEQWQIMEYKSFAFMSLRGPLAKGQGNCCDFAKLSPEFNRPDLKSLSELRPTGGSGIRFIANNLAASFFASPRHRSWCSPVVPMENVISCKTFMMAQVKINTKSRVQAICFTWWLLWDLQEATKTYGDRVFSDFALEVLSPSSGSKSVHVSSRVLVGYRTITECPGWCMAQEIWKNHFLFKSELDLLLSTVHLIF